MENTIILSQARLIEAPLKTVAAFATHNVQPDLLYMDSVLVSTGENKNEDVFLPSEMWKARSSPILKPVDWEHNTGRELLTSPDEELTDSKRIVADNQIIGVMYNSYAAHKDGTVIPNELANAEDFVIPQNFDIVNEAVIYKYLFPKASERIVGYAKAGKLFVSMEAWFGNYDYKVGNKIVARNEETAFLDTYLRARGGDGHFAGQRVGRVLRNIVFGGIGIVANPANVDSIIKSFTNAETKDFDKSINNVVASNIIGEIEVSNDSQEVIEIMGKQTDNVAEATAPQASFSGEDYKEVVQELVKAKHTIETKDADLESTKAKVEELKASVESLSKAFVDGAGVLSEVLGEDASKLSKVDASNFFNALSDVVKSKLAVADELKAKLAEAEQKVEALEVEKRSIERKAQIEQLFAEMDMKKEEDKKKAKEKMEKMAKSTRSLDDEAFAAYLEETKELLALAFSAKSVEDNAPATASEVEDEGETDASVFDRVRATASAPAGSENVDTPDLVDSMKSLAAELVRASRRTKEDK